MVKDCVILKDRVTGQPRGCAFVSYATREEAEAAIAKLDRKLHLTGALSPLEVGAAAARWLQGHREGDTYCPANASRASAHFQGGSWAAPGTSSSHC